MHTTLTAADPVATAARLGLQTPQKSLPPWLFYDEHGSHLFEQITTLPEYYLTRTERTLLHAHIDEILNHIVTAVTVVELGAGTATKTGIVLRAAAANQDKVLYQPIDISPSALAEACADIEANLPGVAVHPQVANYITDPIHILREPDRSVLALYIGSSIGNFSPAEAVGILTNLRSQLRPGDHLLLGTDLAPGTSESSPTKSVQSLLAAYDDARGITAAFNKNILTRINRDLATDFNSENFAHRARWNALDSRIEMHLESLTSQHVTVPADAFGSAFTLAFIPGETIHTENSYKFTPQTIEGLLTPSGFSTAQTFHDSGHFYALTLAEAI